METCWKKDGCEKTPPGWWGKRAIEVRRRLLRLLIQVQPPARRPSEICHQSFKLATLDTNLVSLCHKIVFVNQTYQTVEHIEERRLWTFVPLRPGQKATQQQHSQKAKSKVLQTTSGITLWKALVGRDQASSWSFSSFVQLTGLGLTWISKPESLLKHLLRQTSIFPALEASCPLWVWTQQETRCKQAACGVADRYSVREPIRGGLYFVESVQGTGPTKTTWLKPQLSHQMFF